MHRPENSILSCFFSPQIPPFSSGFIRNNTHLYFIYFYFVLVTFDTSKRSSHLHNDSFSRVYFLLLSCLHTHKDVPFDVGRLLLLLLLPISNFGRSVDCWLSWAQNWNERQIRWLLLLHWIRNDVRIDLNTLCFEPL